MARRSSTGHGTHHHTRTLLSGAEPYIDSVQPTSVGYKQLKYDDTNAILVDDSQNASSSTLPTISGTLGQSPQYHGIPIKQQQQQHLLHQFAGHQPRYFYPTASGHSAPGLSHGHYSSN